MASKKELKARIAVLEKELADLREKVQNTAIPALMKLRDIETKAVVDVR